MAAEMDADVIIIGSGAGGGTLARALASSLSILILERGDYLPREPANWDAETVFNTNRYHTGVDPQQSVFDSTCRSHEFDNLYVADASFMPSISAVNPSLTIMANALRVAEILRHRLGAA